MPDQDPPELGQGILDRLQPVDSSKNRPPMHMKGTNGDLRRD